jgi:dTDP-4-amino-4,6-dideoxygalactose transaminase
LISLHKHVQLPHVPGYATENGHLFYLVCKNESQRNELIKHLQKKNIHAVFHYQSLHKSAFFKNKHDGRELAQSDRYSEGLIRLPFYYELTEADQQAVIKAVREFWNQ